METMKIVMVFGCGVVVGSVATSILLDHKPNEVVTVLVDKFKKDDSSNTVTAKVAKEKEDQ